MSGTRGGGALKGGRKFACSGMGRREGWLRRMKENAPESKDPGVKKKKTGTIRRLSRQTGQKPRTLEEIFVLKKDVEKSAKRRQRPRNHVSSPCRLRSSDNSHRASSAQNSSGIKQMSNWRRSLSGELMSGPSRIT